MKWFGEPWGAPVCEEATHVETPIGVPCLECEQPVEADDRGVILPFLSMEEMTESTFHLGCFLDSLGIFSYMRHTYSDRR